MKQKQKKLTHWLSVIVVGIALGFGLQFVRAWTEPTAAPPNGNVGAPINTGAIAQTKAGNLNVNGGMLIGASTTGGNKGAGTINADQVCIRGVCQTTWPSGGTTQIPYTPQTYLCPDYSSQSFLTDTNCWGQTQFNPTCYCSVYFDITHVPCTPL